MAFLQFLTGPGADELVELNPTATLIIGSSPDSHVRVSDPEVAASHCQVYPAQGAFWLQDLGAGSTVLNMQRLAGETDGLHPNDVFIIGRTFVRFVAQAPASSGVGSTSSGVGMDASAFEAQQREINSLKEEVERLRDFGRKGENLTDTLSDKLNDTKDKFEKARRQIGERDEEILTLRQDRGRNEAKIASLEQDVANAKKEADDLRTELDRRNEQIREFKKQIKGRESELESVRKEQATARVDAKRLKLELGLLEKESQKSLESTKGEATTRIADLESNLANALAALEAARATLESLGVQRPKSDLPSGTKADLDKALAALPDPQRAAIQKALGTYVDQEALRRFSGPLLTWERPESAMATEAQLQAIRSRAEQVELNLSVVETGGR